MYKYINRSMDLLKKNSNKHKTSKSSVMSGKSKFLRYFEIVLRQPFTFRYVAKEH
jgi:hypothetical protein